MPTRPTEEERVAWHVAHAEACNCRAIDGGVRTLLERHGYRIENGKPVARA